ncbi:probable disease resistance protein At4g27220 [Glycine soja]|uniref:probable disease resistance protein At4g27220 n=1 Tax=Glycine soja TaxID=3848 RepID=UPI00103EAE26|nr:probable disease resistance protein At4g27220 [Glycine soja]XP_028215736.1 probable disease resistance protein At4g27220 [Glycine soja]XP_028215737.1 probable disease resistance protein At4g27220 [Glycine soja]
MDQTSSSKRKRGGRPRSKYWNEAEQIGKDMWKCNHCKEKFGGGATRIEEHITGKGNNIRKCPKYSGNVGGHNIIASGPTSPQEALNTLNQLQEDEYNLGDQILEHDPASFESNDIEKAFFYPKGDPDAVCIRKSDIELLQPEKCLNDNIIDFYINYLKNKLPTDKQDRFHFFNCFFFPKLVDLSTDNRSIACDGKAAFQRVSNWTRKVNLFKKDYIFIPINYSLHWSLIVICHPAEVMTCYRDEETKGSPKEACILHMDSRKGIHQDLHNVFQSYLCEEWKERHNNVRDDVSSIFLDLPFLPLELPQQQNAYDCGIFLLHYLERFLEQAPINFNRSLISKFSYWFPLPDASLKRSHIQKLLIAVEGDNKMIVGGSVNPQNNTQLSALLGGDVEDHTVNGGSNGDDALTINQLLSKLTREEDWLHWREFQGNKRKRQDDDWLDKLKDLKKRAIDVKNSLHQSGSTNELPKPSELNAKFIYLLREKRWALRDENVKKMWDLLEDEEVFIIGIDGMGGVGKTFMATHIKNEIKRKGTFKDVFWVTVSHDFTTFKLQHDIAETIQVKLYGDEMTRATILTSELEKREKTLLILDDVWEYIDLQKVGIPLKVNGIKLIITTRLKHVCLQMDCQPRNIITMHPLSDEKAWELFLLKLGHRGTPARLSCEVLEHARSVVMKCYGLPLGISVMARTMKGKNEIHWWRHALNKLDRLEMGEEVLSVLKRSYDNLIEKEIQKCFLQSALFRNDISKERWVMKLVKSGVLNGKGSLEEIFDEARVIVDKLINHSLLLLIHGCLRMNGLVRKMAYHIGNMMVKCDENLRKIPQMREWTADLEAVSLARNEIEEIAEGTSPNCPRLSTFILSENYISHIPKCFFRHMNALTLLDLSYNHRLTSLPKSLSKLRSLTSLVLRGCSNLKDIPPLGDLQALSRLDISDCDLILRVPEGLQNLKKLQCLNLSRNLNLSLVPGCVLPGLSNMQYLDLRGWSGIIVEDVKGMTKLEWFAGSFLDQDYYNRYVQEIQNSGYGPQTYFIYFGINNYTLGFFENPIYLEFKRGRVCFGDCDELPYLLPRDLAELLVIGNHQWECLCAALSSNGSLSLKGIHIQKCTKLKSLFCVSCSLCTNIQNLKSLKLNNLDSLSVICKEDVAGLTQSLSRRGVFSHLKELSIDGCHQIEKLLTPGLVPQLQNLESISVSDCESIKEIFAGDSSDNIALPKLTKLQLSRLTELKTVCKGILLCNSEDILEIYDCPNYETPRIGRYDGFC